MEVEVVSSNLWTSSYTPYQQELFDLIQSKHEQECLNFKVISDYLNSRGYKTTRGKTFTQSHVWSIYTKKKKSIERFYRDFSPSMGKVKLYSL